MGYTLLLILGVVCLAAWVIMLFLKQKSGPGEDITGVVRAMNISSDLNPKEIQRNLSFFWTAATEEPLSAIYLSGGSAAIPGFATQLSQRLGVPVELVDPFRRIGVDGRVDQQLVRENGPAFAVCVGLATRQPGDK